MAWLDLQEGILGEFVDSAAMVQLALDLDACEAMQLTTLSLNVTPATPWNERSKAWLALRNAKRRKKNSPRKPKWSRGLVLADPKDARSKRNKRRRRWYAANAEREAERKRLLTVQRNEALRCRGSNIGRRYAEEIRRERENARARAAYAAKKAAAKPTLRQRLTKEAA